MLTRDNKNSVMIIDNNVDDSTTTVTTTTATTTTTTTTTTTLTSSSAIAETARVTHLLSSTHAYQQTATLCADMQDLAIGSK